MTLPASELSETEERLMSMSLPKGGFTAEARTSALARVRQIGLPSRRDEYWKYTRPDLLAAIDPTSSAPLRTDTPIFGDIDKVRLVFVDGVFDADASDDIKLEGVEVSLLSAADQKDIHWAKSLYGELEAAGQNPVKRPFAALNTTSATEGVLVRATGTAPKPLHISYRQSSQTSDAIIHHCIRVEDGASLTVLETGTPGARSNIVTEFDIMEGATLHHVRPQGRAHNRQVASHIFARVAGNACFKSFTLALNGKLTRNECVIDIVGDDAVAHVAGAALGDGVNGEFHHDDTVFITHRGLNCESRQVFKKVLRNGAVGVFQGKILVEEGAQKTDGYQISQALLLDDDAQFLAKPELEIYADDVACSHGSTSGAIDETALFYLRARGISRQDAQDLLTLAFLAEAIDEIEDQALADDILHRLERWLSRHRGE
ncbi:MAG: Fe-S cluster assembly protein SufD [Boseongicola sp.]|nr:MAG: Fe-S cluster assembly protein SufD [Boseongicola sp.]